jgi:hypothetical protein
MCWEKWERLTEKQERERETELQWADLPDQKAEPEQVEERDDELVRA